jgi:hypothetical protein
MPSTSGHPSIPGFAARRAPIAVKTARVDVTEVKARLDCGDHFVLIDVPEPHEYRICHIPAWSDKVDPSVPKY